MQINVASNNQAIRPFAQRVHGIAEIVKEHAVDILVTQSDVDRECHELLSDRLPDFFEIVRSDGVTIRSRVPLGAVRIAPLTGLGLADDPSPRSLLTAALPDMSTILAVGNFSWAEAQALRNVDDAASALAASPQVVLVGDFNQPPESRAMSNLAEAGFEDAWTRLRPGEPGLTFEISAPSARIDYVLERGASPLVHSIEIVGDTPATAISNHAGLVARIGR